MEIARIGRPSEQFRLEFILEALVTLNGTGSFLFVAAQKVLRRSFVDLGGLLADTSTGNSESPLPARVLCHSDVLLSKIRKVAALPLFIRRQLSDQKWQRCHFLAGLIVEAPPDPLKTLSAPVSGVNVCMTGGTGIDYSIRSATSARFRCVTVYFYHTSANQGLWLWLQWLQGDKNSGGAWQ